MNTSQGLSLSEFFKKYMFSGPINLRGSPPRFTFEVFKYDPTTGEIVGIGDDTRRGLSAIIGNISADNHSPSYCISFIQTFGYGDTLRGKGNIIKANTDILLIGSYRGDAAVFDLSAYPRDKRLANLGGWLNAPDSPLTLELPTASPRTETSRAV